MVLRPPGRLDPEHPMCANVNPVSLSPEQRFRELAGILAAGLLRLESDRRSAAHSAAENPPESGANCLDVPPDSSVTVHTG